MSHYVLICGGRHFADRDRVVEVVRTLAVLYGDELRILHGAAPGADSLGGEAAVEFGVRVKEFPADWKRYDRAAGPIRNREMADYLEMCRSKGHSVQVVAFPGGNGTADMCQVAESRGITVDRV